MFDNEDIDINYCLCWVPEDWTRSWVGDKTQVLLENKYLKEDPETFIESLKKYLQDPRYIKIDGKPLIVVYKTYLIPDIKNIIKKWRTHAKKLGIGDIEVINTVQPFTSNTLSLEKIFDGDVDFFIFNYASKKLQLVYYGDISILNYMYIYNNCVDTYINNHKCHSNKNFYLSSFCDFDNTARYGKNAILNTGFSLLDWYRLNKFVVKKTVEVGNEYMFVFAWNEWSESAYLKPDKKYGYAMINTFSKAIYGLPF